MPANQILPGGIPVEFSSITRGGVQDFTWRACPTPRHRSSSVLPYGPPPHPSDSFCHTYTPSYPAPPPHAHPRAVVLNQLRMATPPSGVLPNVSFVMVITGGINVAIDPLASVLLVTVVPLPSNTIEPPLPNPAPPQFNPYYDPFVPVRAPVAITLTPPPGITGGSCGVEGWPVRRG